MIYTYGPVAIGVDTIGGNITSFQYEGKHIFLPQQAMKEINEWKIRGGSHICLPNYGELKQTGSINLPRHGFIRNTSMTIKKKFLHKTLFKEKFEELNDVALPEDIPFIQSSYCCSGNPFTHDDTTILFPFGFQIYSNIFFLPKGFLQSITICHPPEIKDGIEINKFIPIGQRRAVPVGLGLHPYFNIPDRKANICFKIADGIPEAHPIQELDSKTAEIYGMFLGGVPNNELTVHTEEFKAKVVFGGLFTESRQSKIVLWRNSEQSPYLCVEPIVADRRVFNTQQGVYLLAAQEYVSAWMMVTVE